MSLRSLRSFFFFSFQNKIFVKQVELILIPQLIVFKKVRFFLLNVFFHSCYSSFKCEQCVLIIYFSNFDTKIGFDYWITYFLNKKILFDLLFLFSKFFFFSIKFHFFCSSLSTNYLNLICRNKIRLSIWTIRFFFHCICFTYISTSLVRFKHIISWIFESDATIFFVFLKIFASSYDRFFSYNL